MDDIKKIVFVIGGMGRGGAERVISVLANRLVNQGCNVSIAMLLNNDVDYELDSRIKLINMNQKGNSYGKNVLKWIKALRIYLKKERPDTVISFIARVNLVAIVSSLGLKCNVIVSERSDPNNDGRSGFVDIATKILYKTVDRIVFQSKRAQNHFGNGVQKKSVIISNPISVQCSASDNKEKKIVAVGRFQPEKNHLGLISAFSEIVKEFPEHHLWIYGEGVLRETLEKKIRDLKITDNVHLPGSFLNVHEKIADAQMFVMSSFHEGLSNALLEAMVMGLPCISTDCGGASEYINNMKNGLLIPVNDAKALTDAMKYMLLNQAEREQMGKQAREIISQSSADSVFEKWMQII